MTIKIGNYVFDGPYSDPSALKDQSGVYAVLTRRAANDNFTVIDIGEAGWVNTRLGAHDRQDQWLACRQASGLAFAALYCDEPTRMRIERELRNMYNPACGIR